MSENTIMIGAAVVVGIILLKGYTDRQKTQSEAARAAAEQAQAEADKANAQAGLMSGLGGLAAGLGDFAGAAAGTLALAAQMGGSSAPTSSGEPSFDAGQMY